MVKESTDLTMSQIPGLVCPNSTSHPLSFCAVWKPFVSALIDTIPSFIPITLEGEDPFSFYSLNAHSNIVLVWSGNPALTQSEAALPPSDSGMLLKMDLIKQGKLKLFSGIAPIKM